MPSLLHRQAEAGRYRRPGGALRAAVRPARQEVTLDSSDQLRAVKLAALIADHWGKEAADAAEATSLPGGSARLDPTSRRAWVLIDDGAPRRFGAALAWAWRHQVAELHVVVQGSWASGIVARRAAHLAERPAVRVWEVCGRSVVPATAAGADSSSSVAHDAAAHVDLLREHGAEPVVEHGRLVGEVLGLEVARVVDGRLEVGVGRHDRDARAAIRREDAPGAELDQAVAAVRQWRRPGVVSHPANTLARSRWLRSIVCLEPGLAGAGALAPVPPPLPATDLTDNAAVPAVGVDVAGDAMVAVCSTGVDLDVVPTAADCRGLYLPEARLVIVVPEGDDLPVTRGVARWLDRPAEVRTVPRAWAELGEP